MDKTEELKQNYIRYHKTVDGKHKGISLEFANEIEMDSFLDEYAQQVSREIACDFYVFVKTKILGLANNDDKHALRGIFNTWIKKQR